MIGRLHHVVLDCPDPAGLAFYLLRFAGTADPRLLLTCRLPGAEPSAAIGGAGPGQWALTLFRVRPPNESPGDSAAPSTDQGGATPATGGAIAK
jgi:hypothetical protein